MTLILSDRQYLYLDDEYHGVRHLDRLIAIVLPRYGSFVKALNLFPGPMARVGVTMMDQIGRILSAMPNVATLEVSDLLAGVVAVSPHLASMRRLNLTIHHSNATAAAKLIGKCENITDVSLSIADVRRGGELLVAALASRRSLTSLLIEIFDTLVDFRTMASADWRCPLENLHIQNGNTGTEFSLPSFRTFISHFSSTLLRLEYHATFASWTQELNELYTPFPLPRLVDLTLVPTTVTGKGDTPLVVSLFDKSPIKKAALFQGMRGYGLGPLLDNVVKAFVQAHNGTLKSLCVDIPSSDDDGTRGLTAHEFIKMIKGAGIVLEG